MKHLAIHHFLLAALLAVTTSCSKQKKPKEIPLDVDQAMELYGVAMKQPAPIDPDMVLLTVDGTSITQRELQTEAIKLLRTVNTKNIPPERLQQVQQQLLAQAEQNLVKQKVLLNAMENSNMSVPDEQVEDYLKNVKDSLPEGVSFEQFLTERQVTPEAFKDSIKTEIKVRMLLEANVKPAAEATPADLRAFYTANPDQFNIPEQVAARHLLVKLNTKATGQEFIEKKNKIKALHKRLVAGESFETLIAVESEDTSPDGSLGVLKKGKVLPAIEGPVFALQPGQFTKPIKTDHGFHIIQVQKKFPAKSISFEEAMPQISGFLKRKAQEKAVVDYIKELLDKANVERATPKA